jgi:hypothetical protein
MPYSRASRNPIAKGTKRIKENGFFLKSNLHNFVFEDRASLLAWGFRRSCRVWVGGSCGGGAAVRRGGIVRCK